MLFLTIPYLIATFSSHLVGVASDKPVCKIHIKVVAKQRAHLENIAETG
jgi:hypothetical protein